ncbi:MAG TPA: hypothetical protein VGD68_15835 [Streptosporangiaceae bacterium]
MHVAPTAAASAAVPGRRPRLRARTDHAAVPGLIAAAVVIAEIAARVVILLRGNVSGLALIGNVYGHPAQLPAGVKVFHYAGYDGQFYYRMARSPADLHWSADGVTMDQWYRFVRIGYSALAWLGSAGVPAAVPYALAAINVLAVGAIGVLGGVAARESGRHALWGLLPAGYFGFATSVARDLTEPLAAACLLAGILAFRHRHPLLAAGLFAFGALTRETVLVAPFALAITRLVALARASGPGRDRPGPDDLAWLVPGVVFAAWEVALKRATGVFPILGDGGKNAGVPLRAGLRAIAHNFGHPAAPVPGAPGAVLIWDLEFGVLALVAVAALVSLRPAAVPLYERAAFVLYLVEIWCLAPTNWDGYADLRSFTEVYLLATLILLAAPRRLVWWAACAAPLFVTVAIYRTQIL